MKLPTLYCGIAISIAFHCSLIATEYPTNCWTKAGDGVWEEAFWSLGELPSTNQFAVAFRNPGSKTLTIQRSTTAQHPQTLSVQRLDVGAPDGSTNTLVMDSAGLDAPLHVTWDFSIGSNGALRSIDSAIRADLFAASGPCTFVGGLVDAPRFALGRDAPAEVTFSNSMVNSALFLVGPQTLFARTTRFSSSVHQYGGTNAAGVQTEWLQGIHLNGNSSYHLHDGVLLAGNLHLQAYGNAAGLARFTVSGGYADVGGVLLGVRSGGREGAITLESGEFRSAWIHAMGGAFTQSGGTNISPVLQLPSIDAGRGQYLLSEGTLISSNVTLGFVPQGRGGFAQSGGVHNNLRMSLYGYGDRGGAVPLGEYRISGGLLVSGTMIFIGGNFHQTEGVAHVTNLVTHGAGTVFLSGGSLYSTMHAVDHFVQSGGLHVVGGQLVTKDLTQAAGTLIAPEIIVSRGTCSLGGDVRNSDSFMLHDYTTLRVTKTQTLGNLRVLGRATIDLPNQNTVVRFASAAGHWSDPTKLTIKNWSGSATPGGADRIFFGNNADGLVLSQLQKIVFEDPAGFPLGNYPATILSTGEIVPQSPSMAFSKVDDRLALSWGGNARLYWSTNVAGPFLPVNLAPTNSFETRFADPQRFFLLGPGP